jgi:uncharacterized protein
MISPLKAFDIEFVKLKIGEHQFDYSITNDFFKAFDSSLKAEDLKLNLQFTRGNNMFTLLFKLHGMVKVECDRCLTEIDLPIESENTLMVKITENILEDQDDIIYILPSEYKLNISQPLYDFILLSLPIKKTCDKVGKVCDSSITGKITQVIDIDMQTTEAERTTDIELD